MGYVVNAPNYPDINGQKPDFYALRLIVPGLYSGAFPIGLTAISFGDKLESGRLRGNSQGLLAKTSGKYTAKSSLEMYMNDFYNGLLPFIGNLGLAQVPLPLGAYEQPFNLDLTYSTPNDPFPKTVQVIGTRIGEPTDDQKEGQDPLKIKIELDEPFAIVRNGVIPYAPTQAFWPVAAT